jgi:hypothetical protein
VDVENVPFLVISLKVQVLPCIIAFIDGIGVDRYISSLVTSLNSLTTYRIVGFDDLGNTDNFTTAHLEYRLIETGLDLETLLSNDLQEWYQDREWKEKAR